MEMVVLNRSVVTDVGELAPGTKVPASPSPDGGWLLELSIPAVGVPSHPFPVKASAVQQGKFLLTRWAARYDYRFAREVLGYGHRQAATWLLTGYGVTERQLFRWGIYEPEAEAS